MTGRFSREQFSISRSNYTPSVWASGLDLLCQRRLAFRCSSRKSISVNVHFGGSCRAKNAVSRNCSIHLLSCYASSFQIPRSGSCDHRLRLRAPFAEVPRRSKAKRDANRRHPLEGSGHDEQGVTTETPSHGGLENAPRC